MQEKIKTHNFCETPEEKCTMNYCDENGCQNRKRILVEEPKQETLEEFAERISKGNGSDNWKEIMEGIIEGAKWQQERMYSEMDIILILSKFRDMKMIAFSEWFKQFKTNKI